MPSKILDSLHLNIKVDNPTHVVRFPDKVITLEFSPFKWSHSLVCIAFPEKISVGEIKFQVSNRVFCTYILCIAVTLTISVLVFFYSLYLKVKAFIFWFVL